MTEPNDDEIRAAVEKLLEAAEEKALKQADKKWIDGNGQGHHEPPSEATKTMIKEECEALKERFEDILTPHPKSFDDLIKTAKKVEMALGVFAVDKQLDENSDRIGGDADFGLIDTAKGEIQKDWDGALRNELVEKYLTPLYPNIIATQGSLARYLREHAEIMKRIYERRRRDAKKIAEQGTEAVEAITDSKGSDLKLFLSIIGGLIGLGTAVAGPFASGVAGPLAMGLSSASYSAASAIGGNFIPDDKKEVPLGADTVREVFENIYEALKQSDGTMRDEEDEVLKSLQHVEVAVYPLVMGTNAQLEKGTDLAPMWPKIHKTLDVEELTDGFTVYGDDGDDGSGGRGSWTGPGAPDDWDGAVHDPGQTNSVGYSVARLLGE
ncbi:hypothetical protein FB566_3972 [Stackebrandtia endophytica]|uniref:Uncharacterized protein n=1 Tax=Stackebrandtia endophytica TaxID=1496996 RepID=A0A543B0S5_9ACTN|nr:hypothetical protein [Stackebrandtia endophytica]TQL78386.1 hypothetical protein FB566_3972 [Stackebrandtia endophytica]